ncbi:MAG: Holliday junction resolvase RuvX [Chloroflexi bacterium]|nr:Holliday junction resolvase RuvX [Chloroflexota bacterium]MCC6893543.1 Holliday junction resolvase RuvX [Anaerolineae bacterium]
MSQGKLLGIDHGLKRIGLAVSDAMGVSARELTVINRTTNVNDFARINHVASEQRVVGIVVGMPVNSEAQDGEYTQGDTVRKWIERYAATTALPIVTWDEQLTSLDARELSIQKGRKARDPIDDLAARIILQSYLDALRSGLVK